VSTKHTHSIQDVDRRYVFHPFTAPRRHETDGGLMIVRGEGSVLWDNEGRPYLDAMAGLWCVNVGYGRREMVDAIARQVEQLSYYHGFSSMTTEAPALVAERVVERPRVTGVPMAKMPSETAAPTRTTRRRSSSGSTTTHSGVRRRRRSSPVRAATTA
jgi:L-2,4-diaminobutyrate transaminase